MRWLLVVVLMALAACAPADTATPAATLPAGERPATPPPATLAAEAIPPGFASAEFKTDFTRHSVPFGEIFSGGPPKDGIPPIDAPQFVSVADAEAWLRPVEPVIFVQVGDDARAYPLQILTWHEIVNDTVGGAPLTVTFCPLCNTAIAFERTLGERVLDFGTTGRLRYSNLIMYDRQTESWWQQATGEAILGELTGERLTLYPATIIAWADFMAQHPDGSVLSRETGFSRTYGINPYVGYDDVTQPPFLYRGPETPGRLPPVARVLALELNGETVAYPYAVLEQWHVLNDRAGGENIVVFWQPGTASALDTSTIADGRDVGAASAFISEVDGRPLTMRFVAGKYVDNETGSEWNAFGQAVGGELAGAELEPVVAVNHFWFSWAAFKPETRVFSSPP
jgi:hypothetical protein